MGEHFDYKKLAEGYDDFKRPAIDVLLGGSRIVFGGGIYLEEAQITLSCGSQPNMAVVEMAASRVGGSATGKLEAMLQVGMKVEIRIGYGDKVKPVFLGYLHELAVEAGAEENAVYELTCLDVKGLMMSNALYETSGRKKADQLIKEILGRSRYSSFIEGRKLAAVDDGLNRVCVVNGKSDYEWLTEFAGYAGYEFFLRGGEAVFQKRRQDAGVLTELSREYGLRTVRARVTLAGQTEEVEVTGWDKACKKLAGSARRKNPGGPFEGKLSSALSGSRRTVMDRTVETQAQAVLRAKALLAESLDACSQMQAASMGLPELVPGRFVKVADGIQSSLSGSFYVQEVKHMFDSGGYVTVVTGSR